MFTNCFRMKVTIPALYLSSFECFLYSSSIKILEFFLVEENIGRKCIITSYLIPLEWRLQVNYQQSCGCKTSFDHIEHFQGATTRGCFTLSFYQTAGATQAEVVSIVSVRHTISTTFAFAHLITPVTVVVFVSVYLTCTMSNTVHAVSIFAVVSGATVHRVCDCEGDMV